MPVLAIGGITAVIGVLHALMQRDLKRVLAYSTIENVGLVFVGLGLALAFASNGFPAAAALALTAALFHVFNHALFKSLLFFGAGAVLTATGERNMERLGGLIHGMPVTSLVRPRRLRRDLRAAAAQRLRLGVARLSGDPAEPAASAMGTEAARAGGRGAARARRGAGGGLLRARLRHRVPRPPAQRGGGRAAREVDRFSLAAMVHSRASVPARRHRSRAR